MVDGWSNKKKTYPHYAFLFHVLLMILILVGLVPLVYIEPSVQAQVIVITPVEPNVPAEPEVWEATLKLGGLSCDLNSAESAVLHLPGVIMVDIESKPGHLVVAYEPTKVTPAKMLVAVGKKKGENWFCTATVVGLGRQ